ncbi:hypothetical protein BJY00DRAFT_295579 [Aspergillus carlsbadensis]|nr:hypothetical protein BJY00DRAFT_295579 [Aspergillus carlsbadensis]
MLLMQFTDTLQMIYSLGPAALVKDLQQIGPDGLKMVSKWNLQTWDDHDRIDEMIERQLKNTPDLAAVSAFDGDLKYRELDAFASQLASQLIRRGVRPGTFVGIFLSKSMFAIVSMVAVIRAGGAFVFLSPSLPSLRVKVMCDKTPVDLILTIKSLFEDASEFGPPVLAIEKDETAETIPLITTAATPGDPLYAIYTSGSTGEPKGVVVNRASFGPGARRFMVTFGLHPGCRVFQSVSL